MGAERSLSGRSEPALESQMKKRGYSLCLHANTTLIFFWKEVEITRTKVHICVIVGAVASNPRLISCMSKPPIQGFSIAVSVK